MENRFDRTLSLIGIDKFNKLSNLSILIVGVGGVGGSVFEGLVRSGCNNLTIIDSDTINITNLNRQIISNANNIGKSKVEVTKEYGLSINPSLNIKTHQIFLDKNNINDVFKDKYDLIIDCIDSTTSKLELYKKAIELDIPLISSMGTANKLDPSLIEITRLDKTTIDPLARKMRNLCKENNIDMKKIIVSYSKEPSLTSISNPLPSMMMVPTTNAMIIISYIIRNLLN